MFLSFISRKMMPRENHIQEVKGMLDQTWNLSREFKAPEEGPGAEAIKTFNLFFARLNRIITNILKSIVLLASLAPDLFRFSKDFKDKAVVQQQKIKHISKASLDMAKRIKDIASNTQILSDDSGDIKNEVKDAIDLGEKSMDRFSEIKRYVNDLVNITDVLGENSKSIGSIIDLLNTISDETTILSLNARIEAARNNKDSKGFKVIAEEIAVLAKQSKKATQEIQARLTVLSGKVNETVDAVKMVEKNVSSGEALIANANRSLGRVSVHFENLAKNLAEIKESTALQSRDVKNVAEDIVDIETSLGQQTLEVGNIFQVAEKVTGICDEMILHAGIFHLSSHEKSKNRAEQIAMDANILSFQREKQEASLVDRLAENKFIELAYITDASGRQITHNIYAETVLNLENLGKGYGRDWSQKEWFQKPKQDKVTFISKVYRSSATNEFCFTVSVPLFQKQLFSGVLGIDVNFKDMMDI